MNSIRIDLGGREYVWIGMFGCVLASKERGIKDHEVRYISGELFYAKNRFDYFTGKLVYWAPCQDVDMEWIRRFKAKIIGC